MSIEFTLPRERKWILGVSLMTSNFNFTKFLSFFFSFCLFSLRERAPAKRARLAVNVASDWSADLSRRAKEATRVEIRKQTNVNEKATVKMEIQVFCN